MVRLLSRSLRRIIYCFLSRFGKYRSTRNSPKIHKNTMTVKIYITLLFLLLFTGGYAQSSGEYKLTVGAKISNQGTGQKPGFREWKDYATRTLGTLNGYQPANDDKLNAYGSMIGRQEKATGFFHVAKVNGR